MHTSTDNEVVSEGNTNIVEEQFAGFSGKKMILSNWDLKPDAEGAKVR